MKFIHTVEYYTAVKKNELLITLNINESHKTKELKRPDMKEYIL